GGRGDPRVLESRALRHVRGVGAPGQGPVVGVHEHHARLVGARLGVLHDGVGDDDHQVARVHQVGGGAVDADDARPALAGDGVGGQPGAVVDVDDVDL